MLLETGEVGPIAIGFGPGQAIATGDDEEDAGQVPVEVADRILGELKLGFAVNADLKGFERVEEDDRPAAFALAGGSWPSRSSPSRSASVG